MPPVYSVVIVNDLGEQTLKHNAFKPHQIHNYDKTWFHFLPVVKKE